MIVTAGKTNVSVYYYIVGDASHASPGDPITGLLFSDIETGGSASYARQGAARVDLTLITLASASAAHADGGFILVDDTNMPGVYRCDYPDAAFATGVDQVFLSLVVAAANNAAVAPILVDITDFDLREPTSAANFVSQYDGTGLTGDTYPATQVQINSIGSVSGGFSTPVAGATITTGTQTLTYTATEGEDGILHEIAPSAGNIDFYYELDVGESGAITAVEWVGRVNSNGDTVTVEYYDYVSTSYKTIKTLDGSNSSSLIADIFEIPINGTGTGANIGLGQLRVTSSTATGFDTDSARVKYSERAGGIANGSTVTLAASAANQNYIGNNWTLALGGQDVSSAYIEGASASGVGTSATGDVHFNSCTMGAVTLGACHLSNTAISDTITAGIAGNFMLSDCFSEVAGGGAPVFDFAAVGNVTLHMRRYSGGIELQNMSAGDTMSLEGDGQLIINANCTGGTISRRGNFKETDNAGGAVTITYDDNTGGIAAIEVDTANIQSRIPTALVGGLMDSNIGAIDGNTQLATSLKEFVDANVLFSDTAQAGGAATITLAAGTSVTDDDLHDFAIYINGGTGVGQFARINGVIAATQVATIKTPINGWAIVPDATSTYIILSMGSIVHVSEVHSAAVTQIQSGLATTVNLEARTPTAAQLAYIVSNSADGKPVTFTGGTTTTAILGNVDGVAASSTDDAYNGRVLVFNAGTLDEQATDITDYDGATTTATITAVTTAVTGSHTANLK